MLKGWATRSISLREGRGAMLGREFPSLPRPKAPEKPGEILVDEAWAKLQKARRAVANEMASLEAAYIKKVEAETKYGKAQDRARVV